MANRTYCFDFFECVTRNSNANADLRSTSDMLQIAFERKFSGNSTVKVIAGRNYEFRTIEIGRAHV